MNAYIDYKCYNLTSKDWHRYQCTITYDNYNT